MVADIAKRVVLVSGISTIIVEQIDKFFSRFDTIEKVEPYGEQSVFVIFSSELGVASAVGYNGGTYRDDMVAITVPSEGDVDRLAILLQPGEPTVEDTVVKGRDPLLKVRSNLRECVKGVNTDDLLTLLQSLVLELKQGATDHGDQKPAPGVGDGMNDLLQVKRDAEFQLPNVKMELNPPMRYNFPTPSPDPIVRVPNPLYRPVTPSNFGAALQQPTTPSHSMAGFSPFPSLQYPKIIFFSGDAKDANYQQWRNEVKCLVNEGHPPSNILQGIRRSLKGTAAEVLLNLGEDASPDKILQKFDIIFGVALTAEALLEEYYTARQKEGEAAAVWGCRLESILNKVHRRGYVTANMQEMLRTKFWSGLRDDRIKNAIRHKFDANQDFESLLRAARQVEMESSTTHVDDTFKSKPQAKVGSQQASSMESKLDAFLKQMEEIKSELRDLKSNKNSPQYSSRSQSDTKEQLRASGSCFYCHEPGHFIPDCPKLKNKPPRQQPNSTPSNQGNAHQPTL